jgi:V/A-type H+-transporting ATPase subunit C
MPDFPYVNARIKAMRARLLDAGRLEELLVSPTLDAFIQALNSTPYGHDVQEALTQHAPLQAVDVALARHFSRTTAKILSFADGKARALIEVILLRWDLANLRVILRAKHAGMAAGEVAANLIPAGMLNDPELRELAGQPDVPAVVGALSALNHPLLPPLLEGLARYLETKDLFALELPMERYYAAHGLQVAKGQGYSEQVVRALLQAELDATNAKTARKLQTAAISRQEKARFFIPGGAAVSELVFLQLADRETAEQAVNTLGVQGFPLKAAGEDLTVFERDLDLGIIKAQTSRYLGDPLSIDIVVAYFAMKHNEVKNLRLIARSKQLGIPRDRVRKEMVVV